MHGEEQVRVGGVEFTNVGNLIEDGKEELKSKSPYFMFLVHGDFGPGDVQLLSPTAKRVDSYSQETRAIIYKEWVKREADAKSKGKQLFNSPQLGLEAFAVTGDGKLILKTYETSYMEYVGLRFQTQVPFSEQANPISVGTLIILKDGILIPKRAEKIEYMPGGLEISSGWPTKEEVESGEFLKNPFVTAKREVEEETGIVENGVNIRCRGIVLENHAIHPLLLFEAKIDKSRSEVAALKGDEESEMNFIPNTPEAVLSVISRKSAYSVPPLPAALYDYGCRTFGKEWKKEADAKLARLSHLLNKFVAGPGRKLKGFRGNLND